jgi:hypothetical protein
VKKIVTRKESSGQLDSFEGTVTKIGFETGIAKQYHLHIEPSSFEVKGATKELHEWVPLSPTATEGEVPQGSVMDRYLTQVEICVPEAKKAATVKEALDMLIGKKVRFQRMKLGRDYNGQAAKEYIVPVARL